MVENANLDCCAFELDLEAEHHPLRTKGFSNIRVTAFIEKLYDLPMSQLIS